MIRCGFVKSLVLVAIVTCVTASDGSESSWLGPGFVVLQKVYDDCYDTDDFTGCLKDKAVTALNKAVDQVCSYQRYYNDKCDVTVDL